MSLAIERRTLVSFSSFRVGARVTLKIGYIPGTRPIIGSETDIMGDIYGTPNGEHSHVLHRCLPERAALRESSRYARTVRRLARRGFQPAGTHFNVFVYDTHTSFLDVCLAGSGQVSKRCIYFRSEPPCCCTLIDTTGGGGRCYRTVRYTR